MNAVSYLDFYIEVTGQDAPLYQIAVRSKAGEARSATHFPYTNAELEAELQRLENTILYTQTATRGRLPPQEDAVREFGARFFEFLLPPGETRSLYYECRRLAEFEGKGVRLNLLIQPPHLAALPWEFLHDPRHRDYVALDPYTPLVRYPEVAQSVAPLPVTPPLRILGLVATPTDLLHLDVEAEQRQVMTALQPLLNQGLVEVTWLPGQGWRDLQQWMRPDYGPWHIFHFIGHGSFDPQREEGRIFLADDQGQAQAISATQLSRLLAFQRGTLRLALLNACEGARGGKFDALSSTAATLVLDGLPAVLAMQYAITDSAALEFARTFYSALSDNLPVDAAVAEARNAINLQNSASLEWGTPVLYMRSQDGRLFEIAEHGVTPPQSSLAPAAMIPPSLKPALPDDAKAMSWRRTGLWLVMGFLLLIVLGVRLWPQITNGLRPIAITPSVVTQPSVLGPTVVPFASPSTAITPALTVTTLAPLITPPNTRSTGTLTLTGAVILTTTSSAIAGEMRILPGYDIPFVFIPGGIFKMGSPDGAGERDEHPQHEVSVANFWLGATEVTNAQYSHFVDAGGYTQRQWWTDAGWQWREENKFTEPRYWQDALWNQPTYPVISLTWYEAIAYTRWLSNVTGLLIRLPTEAEWEWAARGHDGRSYPWGMVWDSSRLNYCDKHCAKTFKDANVDDRYAYTAPVGTYGAGATPYGVVDLAGNVWEWLSSKYMIYPYDAQDGREILDGSDRRILRGGAWSTVADDVRTANRDWYEPFNWDYDVGFRLAYGEPAENPTSGAPWHDDRYGIDFVYVPAGEFIMGSTADQISETTEKCRQIYGDCPRAIFEDEAPQQKVMIDGFWIMKTEVTNSQYKKCVDAGVCKNPANDFWTMAEFSQLPVVNINWNQANTYATWVGGRLPTEAEWEKAARGTNGYTYPWGDQWDPKRVNYCDKDCRHDGKEDGYPEAAPVGSFPQGASPYGVFDMAGNVWEWVGDWYDASYYKNSTLQNPRGPSTGELRVLRGGSWYNDLNAVRTTHREGTSPDDQNQVFGFRVAR